MLYSDWTPKTRSSRLASFIPRTSLILNVNNPNHFSYSPKGVHVIVGGGEAITVPRTTESNQNPSKRSAGNDMLLAVAVFSLRVAAGVGLSTTEPPNEIQLSHPEPGWLSWLKGLQDNECCYGGDSDTFLLPNRFVSSDGWGWLIQPCDSMR